MILWWKYASNMPLDETDFTTRKDFSKRRVILNEKNTKQIQV